MRTRTCPSQSVGNREKRNENENVFHKPNVRLVSTERELPRHRNQLSTQPRLKSNGSRTQGSTDVTGVGKTSVPNPLKGEAEVVPPPPWDFVLARLELRPIPNGDGGLRMSIKPEPVHYHPKLSCIRNAHGKKYHPSVEVMEADKEVMDDIHLQHLRNEFGL